MRTWLILGGAGYIGSELTSMIMGTCPNDRVIVADTLIYNQCNVLYHCWMDSYHLRFHNIDIRDTERLKPLVDEADIVVNLAAIVGEPACKRFPIESQEVNSDAVGRLVKLLDKQLLLFPNTNSAYGTSGEDICDENSPVNPISDYSRQKLEAERYVLDYQNSVSLRLATVFGPAPRMRVDLMVNDFVYQCYFNKQLSVFEPNFKRNFIAVTDVCRAFIHLADHGKRQAIYNVGNDDANCTKGELAELVAKMTGATVSFVEGKDPDQRNYNVSSEKLYWTGYEPTVSVEDGIEQLITAYSMLSTNKEVREQQIFGMKNTNYYSWIQSWEHIQEIRSWSVSDKDDIKTLRSMMDKEEVLRKLSK